MKINRQTGTTAKGSRYAILQDGPTSFHITVQDNDRLIYEHFSNPPNLKFLIDEADGMEIELLGIEGTV